MSSISFGSFKYLFLRERSRSEGKKNRFFLTLVLKQGLGMIARCLSDISFIVFIGSAEIVYSLMSPWRDEMGWINKRLSRKRLKCG